MAEEEDKEKAEKKECERPLMCPEEWEEKEGRKVISEYHKEEKDLEEDLDAFEEYWKNKGAINFESEYHKEGAPFMEAPSEWDGHRPRLGEIPDKEAEEEARKGREKARMVVFGTEIDKEGPTLGEAAQQIGQAARQFGSGLDINTLEVVTYAMFRALFGYGLHIPIKKEGVVDLDIVIKGRDFIVNTNQLYFEVPELAVWRIVYSHKGKPIVELGRGVKDGLKIHRMNAVRLGLEVWWGGRKNRIARQKAKKAAAATAANE
jgi:hypothetical protein